MAEAGGPAPADLASSSSVGGLRVIHSSGPGTNAGNRHSIKLYFLPPRGKSVTRRALFPARLSGGLGLRWAVRSWGSWLSCFPSRPRGA